MDSRHTTIGEQLPAHVPQPPSERGHWLLAGSVAVLGVVALVAALTGVVGSSSAVVPSAATPPVLVVAATPVADRGVASTASAAGVGRSQPQAHR